MRLPAEAECAKHPTLNMLRNNDIKGFFSPKKYKNKPFLSRRRINYALELLKNHLSPDKSITIADFACGSANFGLQLFEEGYNVDLIDNEALHFDYIKMKTEANDRLRFFTSDLNTFESDRKYHAIFLGEAIEHMEDPEATLQILRSHLLTGGLLCLTTPNGDFVNGTEPKWHEVKHDKERNKKLANNIGNHVCEFGFDELAKLIKEAGFGMLEHKLVNSDQVSRKSLMRRILPESLLWNLDGKWSKSKTNEGKYWGRIQIVVAQRFH